jgi:hypothetical protein
MTKHPNQAEHRAQRAPRPNRVSYESSCPEFLSHEFSRANSRLAEGLSSKGLKREINGIQGEDKLLSRWDSSRDGLDGRSSLGARRGLEGALMDFFEGPKWLSACGARQGGIKVA